MDSKQAIANTFEAVRSHKSEDIASSHLTIEYALRAQYPDHCITSVSPESAEFLEFADAGNAVATLDVTDGLVERSRSYAAPFNGRVWVSINDAAGKKGTKGGVGTLSDDVKFGKYDYIWEEKTFIVYKITWQEAGWRHVSWFWVLYPKEKSSPVENGNCPEIDALLLSLGRWSSVPHNDLYVFDQGYWRRSRSTWESIKDSKWEDVILDSTLKTQLMNDVQGFFTPETKAIYSQFKVPYKRGIILHGSPGNGKTISVKALIAHLMNLPGDDRIPSLYVKSTADKCNTQHKSIESIFRYARRSAPCLLILEDLDSLITDETRSYFLNEVDGLESNDGILMIGSTNHLDKLDTAITKRPSRFDRKYAFKLPANEERKAYSEYWRGKLSDNANIEFPEEISPLVAQLTEGFSFAYLKELFITTLLAIARGATGDEVDYDIVNEKSAETSEKGDGSASDDNGSSDEEASEEEDDERDKDEEEKPQKGKEENDKNSINPKKERKGKKQPEPKKKREVPVIEVPNVLKDNTFFKVLQLQVAALLKDMDDSDEAEAKKAAKKKKQKKTAKKAMKQVAACAAC